MTVWEHVCVLSRFISSPELTEGLRASQLCGKSHVSPRPLLTAVIKLREGPCLLLTLVAAVF